MPRLAIVISAAGSFEALEATLVSVLENRPADCEVVVALTRPYADPYDLKEEVRFVAPRRRVAATAALNAALATVKAPVVHLLAAGCLASDGWAEPALAHFADRRVAAVVPWVWNAHQPESLFAVGVAYQRRGRRQLVAAGQLGEGYEPPATIVGPAAFAAFYRRSVLELVGGLSNRLTLRQADTDVALAIRQTGLRIVTESRSRIEALENVDAIEGEFREALAEERLFWRNLQGAGLGAMCSHLLLAVADSAQALPRPTAATRLLGRLWASLEWGSHARHRRLLEAMAQRAQPVANSSDRVRIDASHEAPHRADATSGSRVRGR